MPNTWELHESFGFGEISPSLYGLSSNPALRAGCKELTNGYITRYGGAKKRNGSAYVRNTVGDFKARLFAFRPTSGGDYIVQVISDDGVVDARWIVVVDSATGSLVTFADGVLHNPFPGPTETPTIAPGANPATGLTSTNCYMHFYDEAELDTLESFMYEERLYILCPTKPPTVLTKSPNSTWGWSIAAIGTGSPILRNTSYERVTIVPTYESGLTSILNASSPIFTDTGAVVDHIWRVGQQAKQVTGGVSVADGNFGVWFRQISYLGPTSIRGSLMSFADPADAYVEDTDFNDWIGPFVPRVQDVFSYVSGVLGPFSVGVTTGAPTRISSASSVFLPSDTGMIITVGTSGSFSKVALMIYAVISSTQADVVAVGLGPSTLTYPFTGTVNQVTGNPAHIMHADSSKITEVGTDRLLPANHGAAAAFDIIQGTNVGGTVHFAGGVDALAASFDVGSNTREWLSKEIRPFKFRGPCINYGAGWSVGLGFPEVGASHQDRVFLAGASGAGSAILASATGDPDDFEVGGGQAQNALRLDVAASEGGQVTWMASFTDLLFGTDLHEYKLSGSPVSSLSLGVDRQTGYGGKRVPTVQAGGAILFVGRGGRNLRAAAFEFRRDRYVAPDVTDTAEHLFPDGYGIARLAYAAHPDQVAVALTSNGTRNILYALTARPENAIQGWSEWELSGSVDIEDVVTCSNEFFWVIVNRTIEGSTIRTIEKIGAGQVTDSALTLTTGITQNQLTGVDHLHLETVQVIADGIYIGDYAVNSSGQVNITGVLTAAPTEVIVGLPVTYTMTPTNVPVEDRFQGWSSGQIRRISRLLVLLRNARGLIVEGSAHQVVPAGVAGTAIAVQNGWQDIPVIGEHGRDPDVTLTQTAPYEIEVASMNVRVEREEQ